MPTVPTYDTFDTAPSIAPSDTVSSPSDPQIANQQTGALDDALANAGSQVNTMQVQALQRANQAVAIDADNQATAAALDILHNPQTGFLNLKGQAAFQADPSTGLSPADTVMQNYQQKISDIAGNLNNPQQSAAFMQSAQKQVNDLQQQLWAHQMQEQNTYMGSVYDGTAQIQRQNIEANATNPNVVQTAIDKMDSAIYLKGQQSGLAAEQIQANINTAHSTALIGAFNNLMSQGSTSDAQTFYNQWQSKMVPSDQITANLALKKDTDSSTAEGYANTFAQSGFANKNPTNLQTLFSLVSKQESGGHNTNPDGSVVTNPSTGAAGSMQVMAKTLSDPGFGVTPWNGTTQDLPRVGQDYLQAMLKHYNGNVQNALAAYNWGPANMDSYLKTGQGVMPTETKNYVNNIMQKLQTNASAPSEQVGETEQLSQIQAMQQKMANDGVTQSVIDNATDRLKNKFAMVNANVKAQNDDTTNNLSQAIVQANGNISDPNVQQAMVGVDPDIRVKAMQQATQLAKGAQIDDPVTYANVTNPQWLATHSMADVQATQLSLSSSSFNQAIKAKNAQLAGGSNSPQNLNQYAFNAAFDSQLAIAGINLNTSIKSGTPNNAADLSRYNALHSMMVQRVLADQAAAGKQFNQVDIGNSIGNALSTPVTWQTHRDFGLWTTPSTPITQPMGSLTSADLPPNTLSSIKTAYAQRGITPSEGQIMGAYWQAQGLGKHH